MRPRNPDEQVSSQRGLLANGRWRGGVGADSDSVACCALPETAAVTGHSLKTIEAILRHHLTPLEAHADAAIDKLLTRMDREGVAL